MPSSSGGRPDKVGTGDHASRGVEDVNDAEVEPHIATRQSIVVVGDGYPWPVTIGSIQAEEQKNKSTPSKTS